MGETKAWEAAHPSIERRRRLRRRSTTVLRSRCGFAANGRYGRRPTASKPEPEFVRRIHSPECGAAGSCRCRSQSSRLARRRAIILRFRPVPRVLKQQIQLQQSGNRTSVRRPAGVDFAPNVDALRAAPTTVVIGVGEESGGPEDGHIAARAAYSTAALLGSEPIVFPGGHSGFLGGEFGQTGKPTEFAESLRKVLG